MILLLSVWHYVVSVVLMLSVWYDVRVIVMLSVWYDVVSALHVCFHCMPTDDERTARVVLIVVLTSGVVIVAVVVTFVYLKRCVCILLIRLVRVYVD